MKISKMAPVFEQLSQKMPLQLNAANLGNWLETLDPAEAYYSCGKLLRVMKSLEADQLQTDIEFESFSAILAALDRVGAKLEKPLLEAGSPVGVSERTNTELLIYSYAEVARRFWNLSSDFAKQKSANGVKKNVAHSLFNALEALRRALLYISLLYDRPYEGFWRMCYQIYLRAEAMGILANAIGIGAAAATETVENNFKSLLVFYLSDASILTQREMKGLFMLFQHRPVPLKVYTQVNAEQLALSFAFAPESDAPPVRAEHLEQLGERMRYISTIKVARMAYTNLKDDGNDLEKSEAGNYSLFSKLAKVLSMKATRKFSRVAEQRECQALFGLNNVLNYFTNKCDAAWDASDLTLIPCGEEDFHRITESKTITPVSDTKQNLFKDGNLTGAVMGSIPRRNNGRGKRFIFENITIVNSSAKDYCVVRSNPGVPVKIGELLGILSPADGRMEIGLIRRMTYYEQLETEIGLELISLQANVVIIWRSSKNFDRQMVLFLPGIGALQQNDAIMFRSYAFSAGETIIMQQGSRKIGYRINKLLHTTHEFTHAELALIEGDEVQE